MPPDRTGGRHDAKLSLVILILILIAVSGPCSSAQSNPRLQTFFEQNVGLTQDQIDDIRHGIPVVKILPVRASTEVFLFGAIYIHAAPESYPRLVLNLDNLRRLPNLPGSQSVPATAAPRRLERLFAG